MNKKEGKDWVEVVKEWIKNIKNLGGGVKKSRKKVFWKSSFLKVFFVLLFQRMIKPEMKSRMLHLSDLFSTPSSAADGNSWQY